MNPRDVKTWALPNRLRAPTLALALWVESLRQVENDTAKAYHASLTPK